MVPEITIYIDPSCPHCHQLIDYLKRKQVPYYEHDVTRDVHAQEYLRKINAAGVPVIRVGEEHVVGFDETRLNELIRASEVADVGA
jgi:glutaredoxin